MKGSSRLGSLMPLLDLERAGPHIAAGRETGHENGWKWWDFEATHRTSEDFHSPYFLVCQEGDEGKGGQECGGGQGDPR